MSVKEIAPDPVEQARREIHRIAEQQQKRVERIFIQGGPEVLYVEEARKVYAFVFPDKGINPFYVEADSTYSLRALIDVLAATHNVRPAAGLQPFTDSNVNIAYQLSGITTGLNAIAGYLAAQNKWQQWSMAKEVGDSNGAFQAGSDFVMSAAQAVGGLSFLLYRPLSIASGLQQAPVSSFNGPNALGNAAYGSLQIGTGIFGLFYLMGVVSSASVIKEVDDFEAELNKRETDDEKLEFLKDSLEGLESEITDSKEACIEEAIATGERNLEILFKEMKKAGIKDVPNLNKKERRLVIERAMPEGELAGYGKDIKLQKLRIKKEMVLVRVTSPKCVQMLKETEMDGVEAESAEVIVAETKAAMKVNRTIYGTLLATCLLGVLATIAGFIFVSGIGAIVVAAAFVLVVIGMFIVDAYCLKQTLNAGVPSSSDLWLLKANFVVGSLAVVLSMVLTLLFAPAIFPIILTVVFGLAWLGVNSYAYVRIIRAGQKHQEECPSLEFFKEVLRDGKGYTGKRVAEIYNNLLPEDQDALLADFPEEIAQDDGTNDNLREIAKTHRLAFANEVEYHLNTMKKKKTQELQEIHNRLAESVRWAIAENQKQSERVSVGDRSPFLHLS